MNYELTKETLEGYFRCRYKFYLYSLGEKGVKSDYEKLLAESRQDFMQKAAQKTLAHFAETEVAWNVTLTRQLLHQGSQYIFNGTAKDGN